MPIYEYKCQECSNKFEAIRSMNLANDPIECSNCKSRKTKRLLSKFYAHGESIRSMQSSGSCGSCVGGACATCNH